MVPFLFSARSLFTLAFGIAKSEHQGMSKYTPRVALVALMLLSGSNAFAQRIVLRAPRPVVVVPRVVAPRVVVPRVVVPRVVAPRAVVVAPRQHAVVVDDSKPLAAVAPVVIAPAPVFMAPAPVVVAPRVVVAPAPRVVVAPAPRVVIAPVRPRAAVVIRPPRGRIVIR